MADYISREAAVRAIDVKNIYHGIIEPLQEILCDIPAADVRPVVLCRECKYSYDSVGGWCCSHGICVDCIVREDFFCADGEKREES